MGRWKVRGWSHEALERAIGAGISAALFGWLTIQIDLYVSDSSWLLLIPVGPAAIAIAFALPTLNGRQYALNAAVAVTVIPLTIGSLVARTNPTGDFGFLYIVMMSGALGLLGVVVTSLVIPLLRGIRRGASGTG